MSQASEKKGLRLSIVLVSISLIIIGVICYKNYIPDAYPASFYQQVEIIEAPKTDLPWKETSHKRTLADRIKPKENHDVIWVSSHYRFRIYANNGGLKTPPTEIHDPNRLACFNLRDTEQGEKALGVDGFLVIYGPRGTYRVPFRLVYDKQGRDNEFFVRIAEENDLQHPPLFYRISQEKK